MSESTKKASDTIAGLLMMALIGGGFYACHAINTSSEERARVLASTSDPETIARLVLHPGAKPEVARSGDVLQVSSQISSLHSFHYEATELLPQLFAKVPDAKIIRLVGRADLVDLRGHSVNFPVARLEIRRDSNADVNWPNVLAENVPRIVDKYWAHPAMLK